MVALNFVQPDQIAGMPPSAVAIALVQWNCTPNYRPPGILFNASAIAGHFSHNGHNREGIQRAISEGIAWGIANGLLAFAYPSLNRDDLLVTRMALRLHEEGKLPTWLPAAGFTRADLHPRIADASWDQLCAGEYDVAVFKAFRVLEESLTNAVPECRGRAGSEVFNIAFNRESGPLRDPNMELGEREAWRSLFAGAYGAFRNPPAHRSGTKLAAAAVREELVLASLLMRKIEEALTRRGEGADDAKSPG